MFQRLYFPIMLFIIIVLSSSVKIYAQEKESDIIIIKKRVGEEKFKQIPTTELTIKMYEERIDSLREIKIQKKEQDVLEQVIYGAIGNVLGFLGATLIFEGSGYPMEEGGALVPWFIGGNLGCSLTVYAIGNTDEQTGSYFATLGGSILGSALQILVMVGVGVSSNEEIAAGFILFSVIPSAGATWAFNKTKKYKTPSNSETALINFRDGQTKFAVPKIYFQPNPFDKSDLIQTIDLVKVRF